MTAGPFGEVDLDLLADYVGGALDGTPDEAAVARLVRDDPAWAAAYDLLVPALDEVHADLVGFGGRPEPMPADVTDRLVSALAAAVPVGPRMGERAPQATGEPRLSRVPVQISGGTTRPAGHGPAGRSRRRWSRFAGVAAVVTAVVGLGGVGLSQLVANDFGTTVADSSAGDRNVPDQRPEGAGQPGPRAAGSPGVLLAPAAGQPMASGTDYTPQSLTRADAPIPAQSGGPAPNSVDGRTRYPVDLTRLADPTALRLCLDEIASAHGQAPVTVTFVDYAAFNGSPALVVRFTDGSGTHWVWAAGPECGVPGSGADTRFRSRVG